MPDGVNVLHMQTLNLHSHLLRWVYITPISLIRKPGRRELRPAPQGVTAGMCESTQFEQLDPPACALKHDVCMAAHEEAVKQTTPGRRSGVAVDRIKWRSRHITVYVIGYPVWVGWERRGKGTE